MIDPHTKAVLEGGSALIVGLQFEGPLVRAMEDEDYRILVHGGQQAYRALRS